MKYFYLINFVLYYLVSVLSSFIFYLVDYKQGDSIPGGWESIISYMSYAFIIIIVESFIVIRIINIMNEGITSGSKILPSFSLKSYALKILLSQVEKIDFYLDVVFINQVFQ
jgi:hypothetical protein